MKKSNLVIDYVTRYSEIRALDHDIEPITTDVQAAFGKLTMENLGRVQPNNLGQGDEWNILITVENPLDGICYFSIDYGKMNDENLLKMEADLRAISGYFWKGISSYMKKNQGAGGEG